MPGRSLLPLLLALLTVPACTAASRTPRPPWRARLALAPDGTVEVRLRLPGEVGRLHALPDAPPLRDLALRTPSGWQPLEAGDSGILLPRGTRDPELRYRFRPSPEADGDILPLPGGGCLLLAPEASPAVLLVEAPDLPPGVALASSWFPAGPEIAAARDGAPTSPPPWALPVRLLERAPWMALVRRPLQRIPIATGSVDVLFLDPMSPARQRAVRDWAADAAADVAGWLGAFPVPHLLVRVRAGRGAGTFGRTWGGGGARIDVWVGPRATAATLTGDWMLAHEMAHLALPLLDARHHWLEEGLATYLESLVRLAGGHMSATEFWGRLYRGLPQGQPGPGDQGLDRTRTWGRTYWGGALYWFVADLEVRRRSGGRLDLADGLAAFRERGWSMAVARPVPKVLAAADTATGGHTFTALHDAWSRTPVRVDLDAIWRALGVEAAGDHGVRLDDGAPEAALRRAWGGRHEGKRGGRPSGRPPR